MQQQEELYQLSLGNMGEIVIEKERTSQDTVSYALSIDLEASASLTTP